MKLDWAAIRDIWTLCAEKEEARKTELQVNIPFYQRPYSWKEEHIHNLVSDFNNNLETGDNKEYFTGSVVVVKEDEDTKLNLIDGQQRITTLFLLNYLNFLISRSYIEEELILKECANVSEELSTLSDSYYYLTSRQGKDIFNDIKTDLSSLINKKLQSTDTSNISSDFDDILKKFQNTIALPNKNLTDESVYLHDTIKLNEKYLNPNQLALTYSRKSYNEQLKEALSRVTIVVDHSRNIEFLCQKHENEYSYVNQYINALSALFENILSACNYYDPQNHDIPIVKAKKIITFISSMLKNVKFCVVRTSSLSDAYTLFEVLNDRALTVDDLDLVKNIIFKHYCISSNDEETTKDINIESLDKLWGEAFESGKKTQNKLIAYLGTVYLTQDTSIQYKETSKYRSPNEKRLKSIQKYNYISAKRDIQIFKMVKTILVNFELRYQNQNDKVIELEINPNNTFIIRAINLLHAFNYHGVLPALVNPIIDSFISNYSNDTNQEINCDRFEKYVNSLKSINCKNTEYKNDYIQLEKWAFEIWKATLKAKGYDTLRKKITINVIRNKSTEISKDTETILNDEFNTVINDWRYGKDNLRAKVLFINLFSTVKNSSNKLIFDTPAGYSFKTTKIHLDHLDAETPDPNCPEKYFRPKTPGFLREDFTNSIGNMMCLDSEDNNSKSNGPLFDSIIYYSNLHPNHWMITELFDMLNDSQNAASVSIGDKIVKVPNENFFSTRKKMLLNYFTEMLGRTLSI